MTTIVCIFGALLLIYRGLQTVDNYYKFDGTVTSLVIQKFQSGKSGFAYSLDFGISEAYKIYGIYLGTRKQVHSNDLKDKIEIGKTYTFYLDPTVSTSSDGHNLGIREIRSKKKIIYREKPNVNYIGGSLFLIVGIGSLAILIYADRRRKNVP